MHKLAVAIFTLFLIHLLLHFHHPLHRNTSSIHPSIIPIPAIYQMSPKYPIPEWQKSKVPIKTIKAVWEELSVERGVVEELLREAKVCPHGHLD